MFTIGWLKNWPSLQCQPTKKCRLAKTCTRLSTPALVPRSPNRVEERNRKRNNKNSEKKFFFSLSFFCSLWGIHNLACVAGERKSIFSEALEFSWCWSLRNTQWRWTEKKQTESDERVSFSPIVIYCRGCWWQIKCGCFLELIIYSRFFRNSKKKYSIYTCRKDNRVNFVQF